MIELILTMIFVIVIGLVLVIFTAVLFGDDR